MKTGNYLTKKAPGEWDFVTLMNLNNQSTIFLKKNFNRGPLRGLRRLSLMTWTPSWNSLLQYTAVCIPIFLLVNTGIVWSFEVLGRDLLSTDTLGICPKIDKKLNKEPKPSATSRKKNSRGKKEEHWSKNTCKSHPKHGSAIRRNSNANPGSFLG